MVSGLLVSSGSLTIGGLLSFYSIMSFLFEPIEKMMNMHQLIEKTVISLKRLEDVVCGAKDVSSFDLNNRDDLIKGIGVYVENVSYSYNYTNDVLSDISLRIDKGECIGIVGKSGCGKSTLGRIISGMLEPDTGRVSYYADAHNPIKVEDAIKRICYVSQNEKFFEGTIRENLSASDPGISIAMITRACILTGLHSEIEAMPLKYDTVLFANAFNLSTGQRQRLSVARALLRTPDLLVLDEVTSNLDLYSKQHIKDVLSEIKGMITCVIITHDDELISICDRCVNIEGEQF